METGSQTIISDANFVTVCNDRAGAAKECYELALDGDGKLPMGTLHVQFPSATAIKYKNPETGIMRILTQVRDRISAPPEGWGKIQFTTVNPINQDPLKRGAVTDAVLGPPPSKQGRGLLQSPPVNQIRPQLGPPQMGPPRFPMGGVLPVNGPMMNSAMPMNMMTSQGGPPAPGGFGVAGMQQGGFRMAPQQDYNFADDTFNFRPPSGGGGGGPGVDFSSPHFTSYCDLCHVALPNAVQSRMHFDGKRHADAVLSRTPPVDPAIFTIGGGMPPNMGASMAPPFNNAFMNNAGGAPNFAAAGPRHGGGIGGLNRFGASSRGRQRGGAGPSGGRGKPFVSSNGRQRGAAGGRGSAGVNRGGRGAAKSTPNGKASAGARSFTSDDHSTVRG